MSFDVRLEPDELIQTDDGLSVSPETVGRLFARLCDDGQCRALVSAAANAVLWGPRRASQFRAAGAHVASCDCSSDNARLLVRALYAGLMEGGHT